MLQTNNSTMGKSSFSSLTLLNKMNHEQIILESAHDAMTFRLMH